MCVQEYHRRDGHFFPRVVLGLPRVKSKHKTAGLETVSASRATYPDCLAFDESSFALIKKRFTAIGTGIAYEVRTKFEQYLHQRSAISQE